MDRIRRALDLARAERAGNLAVTVGLPASSEVITVRQRRARTAIAAVKPLPAVEPVELQPEPARPIAAAAAPQPAVEALARRDEAPQPAFEVTERLDEGLLPAFAVTERLDEALPPAFEAAARPDEELQSVAAAESRPESETSAGPKLPTRIKYTITKTFAPPADLLESHRIVDGSRSSAAAAAFRMLRTQVLQRMEEHRWRSLAVLSPGSDDGKTTTAINLAINLANDHRHTVLLVEFDLRQPTIADTLGIVPEVGADDLLRGDTGVENCLYHPEGFDRLVVLPARAAMDHSSEALVGPHCREVVAELRDRYLDRLLVFDLPPVLGADDALAFAPLVDCALVVVAEGATRRDDLLRCMELLHRTPIVGTVLNRATDTASAYG